MLSTFANSFSKICGFSGLNAALFVALKQAMPDQAIVVNHPIKVLVVILSPPCCSIAAEPYLIYFVFVLFCFVLFCFVLFLKHIPMVLLTGSLFLWAFLGYSKEFSNIVFGSFFSWLLLRCGSNYFGILSH